MIPHQELCLPKSRSKLSAPQVMGTNKLTLLQRLQQRLCYRINHLRISSSRICRCSFYYEFLGNEVWTSQDFGGSGGIDHSWISLSCYHTSFSCCGYCLRSRVSSWISVDVISSFFIAGVGMAVNLAIVPNLASSTTLLGISQGCYDIGGFIGPLIAKYLVSRGVKWSR